MLSLVGQCSHTPPDWFSVTPPLALAVGAATVGFGKRLMLHMVQNEYLWPPGVLVSRARCLLRVCSESHTIRCVYLNVAYKLFLTLRHPLWGQPMDVLYLACSLVRHL